MKAGDDFIREKRFKLRRRVERVSAPREVTDRMKDFVETRQAVEAYLEPQTLDQPLSVVLVAKDGEWQRFSPADERLLGRLSKKTGMPVYEVARVGYPRRMKEYRRGE